MDLDDLYSRACAAVERANYEYAVRLLRQVLSQDPGYSNARHVLRATERRQMEEQGKSPVARILWPIHALTALVKAGLAKGAKKLEIFEDYLEKHPSSAWGAFQLARAAEEAGLKEQAIELYGDALRVDPSNAKALRSISDLLKDVDRVPEALPYVQRLAELKPDDRELQRELRDLEATEHMASHKMDEARSFRDLIRDKDEAERLEEDRREAVTMDDLRAEIVRLEEELEEQPEHVNRILRLARLYQDTGQYDKALAFLKEKHQLLPDNYELRERLGDVQLAIYDRAIAAARAKLQDDPGNEELRAKIDQLRKRRSELGIREYRWRRAEHPTDRAVVLELGRYYFDAGQYNDAIACFQEAAQEARYADTAITYLGRSFLQKGQYDLAVEQFNRAIETHPQMDEQGKAIHYSKGQALEAMDDEQEALAVYKKIYSQDINYRDVAQKVDALGE